MLQPDSLHLPSSPPLIPHLPIHPSLPPSLPHSLTHSLPAFLPPSLPPSIPPSLTPSLPPCLPPFTPPSLPLSLPQPRSPSLPHLWARRNSSRKTSSPYSNVVWRAGHPSCVCCQQFASLMEDGAWCAAAKRHPLCCSPTIRPSPHAFFTLFPMQMHVLVLFSCPPSPFQASLDFLDELASFAKSPEDRAQWGRVVSQVLWVRDHPLTRPTSCARSTAPHSTAPHSRAATPAPYPSLGNCRRRPPPRCTSAAPHLASVPRRTKGRAVGAGKLACLSVLGCGDLLLYSQPLVHSVSHLLCPFRSALRTCVHGVKAAVLRDR